MSLLMKKCAGPETKETELMPFKWIMGVKFPAVDK